MDRKATRARKSKTTRARKSTVAKLTPEEKRALERVRMAGYLAFWSSPADYSGFILHRAPEEPFYDFDESLECSEVDYDVALSLIKKGYLVNDYGIYYRPAPLRKRRASGSV